MFVAENDPNRVAALISRYVAATAGWELSHKEHSLLLDVPESTWRRFKQGKFAGRLGQDKVMRITLVVEIEKYLRKVGHGHFWLLAHNALPQYKGAPPITKIFDGGIPELFRILAYVATWAEGSTQTRP